MCCVVFWVLIAWEPLTWWSSNGYHVSFHILHFAAFCTQTCHNKRHEVCTYRSSIYIVLHSWVLVFEYIIYEIQILNKSLAYWVPCCRKTLLFRSIDMHWLYALCIYCEIIQINADLGLVENKVTNTQARPSMCSFQYQLCYNWLIASFQFVSK